MILGRQISISFKIVQSSEVTWFRHKTKKPKLNGSLHSLKLSFCHLGGYLVISFVHQSGLLSIMWHIAAMGISTFLESNTSLYLAGEMFTSILAVSSCLF